MQSRLLIWLGISTDASRLNSLKTTSLFKWATKPALKHPMGRAHLEPAALLVTHTFFIVTWRRMENT